MADGEVRIDITADDSDIKKKLKNVEDIATDTGEKLIDLGETSEEAGEKVKDLGEKSEKAGKKVEDLGEKSEKAEKGFNFMDIAAGNLVSGGLSSLVKGIGEVFLQLINLADETREFREDMAKLDTAFKSTGHTTEDAKKAYEGFYAILGESDRSVEAVNHLAELTSNTEELAQWQTIAAGVTAKFGDSLPIEGLTEASNETAKVGQVTGVLADALNWAGISEDKFNEQLKKCTTEQQRATLITNTLNGIYSDAAAEYNKLTAETQNARLATARMEEAQAALGAIMEPVSTGITNAKAALFEWAVESLSAKQTNDAFTESQRETVTASNEVAAAYREKKEAAHEAALAQISDVDYATNILLPQLQEIVDANGEVKKGYEERAAYILGAMNEAWGTEYTRVSEIIGKNGELKQSIEEVINTKKAQILLSAHEEDYKAALLNSTQAEEAWVIASMARAKAMEEVKAAEAELTKAMEAEKDERGILAGMDTTTAQVNLAEKKRILQEQDKAYEESFANYQMYSADKAAYEHANTLIMGGNIDEAITYLEKLNSGYDKATGNVQKNTNEQIGILEDQVIKTSIHLGLLEGEYKEKQGKMTDAQKKEFEKRIEAAKKEAQDARSEYAKVGGNLVEGLVKGAEDKDGNPVWSLAGKLRNIVRNALDQAKAEADVHSPSKKTEWISEMMMDGFSNGITKNANQVISDIKELGGEMLSAMSETSAENIKRLEKEIDELSKKRDGANKEEIKAVEKQLAELSELKNDAYDEDIKRLEKENYELSDMRNKNNASSIDAQKKANDKEIRLLKEQKEASQKSINDKKAELQKKLRLLKEDRELTQEQLEAKKEALQEELSIEKEREKALIKYADTFEKQMQKFSALEESYVSAGAKIFEQLDKDINAAQKSYDDAFASRVEAIKSGLSLFELYEKGDRVKGSELTKNLKSQVSGLQQYNKALEELSGKGINAAFVDELKAMGMDALPQLEAINKMSEKQLSEYVALWEEKNALAASAATKEMETQREETEAEIELLKKNANKEFEDLRADYRRKLLELSGEIGAGLKESGIKGLEEMGAFISDYVSLGENLMEGLAKGIEDKEADVINRVVENIRNAIKAAKEEAGIHSPSKVTKDEIGANMALGVGEGWKEKLSNLKNSVSSGIADTISHLRATVAAESSRFAASPGYADNGITDLARAVGIQTAGINSLAGEYRKGSGNTRPVVLQLNGRELGRAVVDVGGAEESRIGTKISIVGGAH